MTITLPVFSLIMLVGASGSGKSTFARRHFRPTEVLSSDTCRGWVSDDETDQSATKDAFEVLHFIAAKRLAARRLTVIDATNVQPDARKSLLALARRWHCLPVAIVLDLPPALCHGRNQARADRQFGSEVVRRQADQLKRSLRSLKKEGFRQIVRLDSPEAIEAVRIERQPLWNDRRADTGPFDLIGDVHGCFFELCDLLRTLGYQVNDDPAQPSAQHPEGRRALFLGDLVDRGPATPAVLRLVMQMTAAGQALCVPGNHEAKLKKWLDGRQVKPTHGLAESIAQLEKESAAFRAQVRDWIDGLVSHYVLDGGNLVAAHAGLAEEFQGRASGAVRSFALYGETTGETDAFGLPVRHDWAAAYRGRAHVVYGHTPVPEPVWINRTLCLDTGCVFGGRLTSLRWPEKAIISVLARQPYYQPVRPLADPSTLIARPADLLDITDIQGLRHIETALIPRVRIGEDQAAAALEVMSRFAVDPHWLIYLPPTMAPAATCPEGEYLEHPRPVLEDYRRGGVTRLIGQEKHMGSRAVVIVTRADGVAARRFGATDRREGVIHTRTGRPFFADRALERALLERLRGAVAASGLWEEFNTDWLALDAELMPWSAKALELLKSQYATVGAAGQRGLAAAVDLLDQAVARGGAPEDLLARFRARQTMLDDYVAAYRRYCWDTPSLEDYRLAPFHLLAAEGRTFSDRDHLWHIQTLARLCAADALLQATAYRLVNLEDAHSEQALIDWWLELTGRGGEGLVIKPLDWVTTSQSGQRGKWVQPAIKCRGREYLRIIYGPEYTHPEHLGRLRARSLGSKRALALREYALGLEALHRFVSGEPLYRVHECVFGVLALESEGVDPRL
ncbi:polynucleotide kinase-phosphatase [Thiorhodovibrio frisius]|uniref:Polynucleotide kinase-phosphatase n=1 Tax=Thiorhodovibrio frisius TaxID=631362 RepID=H8YVD6_9GAMM|nr:polynucleotide kinase-phosphatase [Thiorhodovibrio frisius]EIC23876.1 polynucleotide kinase-phosphatase [Thiorhodovibrio frisius]WPL23119.1 Bis(5'-nucleosyl)-tetraphosphatase PrpE [asymmetrical] [Thiorhodovibrio frisius]